MNDREIALGMLSECVAGRTHQIARIVSAEYDKALKEFELTANQLTLLCMTALMQPVRAQDMLPYLKMEQSTLSRSLDRLVAKGWLARQPDPEDSRAVRVALTAQGSEKLHAAQEGWQQAQDWAIKALGAEGIDGFHQTAHRLNPLMPLPERD